jgi:integrase
MAKSEPIRNEKEIEQIEDYYISKRQIRNYVLFVAGTYTALRISDLLKLKWGDLYNFKKENYYKHLLVIEGKTKKERKIALNENFVTALNLYRSMLSECSAETWLFPSRKKGNPIGRIQAFKIIREAVNDLNIQGNISPHSMRKIIGYHSWDDGKSRAIIMDLYGHSSEEVTKRYLGITQDEIDKLYLNKNYGNKSRKAVRNEML